MELCLRALDVMQTSRQGSAGGGEQFTLWFKSLRKVPVLPVADDAISPAPVGHRRGRARRRVLGERQPEEAANRPCMMAQVPPGQVIQG